MDDHQMVRQARRVTRHGSRSSARMPQFMIADRCGQQQSVIGREEAQGGRQLPRAIQTSEGWRR